MKTYKSYRPTADNNDKMKAKAKWPEFKNWFDIFKIEIKSLGLCPDANYAAFIESTSSNDWKITVYNGSGVSFAVDFGTCTCVIYMHKDGVINEHVHVDEALRLWKIFYASTVMCS